jgi:hypothetical protein
MSRPMDATRLYNDRTYADALLVAGEKSLKVHRCVLDVVPFFEAAFRNAGSMKEGKGVVPTIDVKVPYESLCTFLKYVYGLPQRECFTLDTLELLRTVEDCAMFLYRPFVEAAWRVAIRGYDDGDEEVAETPPEERQRCLEFAAQHELPVSIEEEDAVLDLSFVAVLYLLKDEKRWTTSHTGARLQLALAWMEKNPERLEECHELAGLCVTANRSPITPTFGRVLCQLSQFKALNVLAYKLIIHVLSQFVEADRPAVAKPVVAPKLPAVKAAVYKQASTKAIIAKMKAAPQELADLEGDYDDDDH